MIKTQFWSWWPYACSEAFPWPLLWPFREGGYQIFDLSVLSTYNDSKKKKKKKSLSLPTIYLFPFDLREGSGLLIPFQQYLFYLNLSPITWLFPDSLYLQSGLSKLKRQNKPFLTPVSYSDHFFPLPFTTKAPETGGKYSAPASSPPTHVWSHAGWLVPPSRHCAAPRGLSGLLMDQVKECSWA